MDASASTDIMSKVSAGLVEGIGKISGSMGDFIVTALPYVLGIVGAVIVIGFGIKLFRKFAK